MCYVKRLLLNGKGPRWQMNNNALKKSVKPQPVNEKIHM